MKEVKYGEWDMGKHLRWFVATEVNLINSGEKGFEKPDGFDQNVESIRSNTGKRGSSQAETATAPAAKAALVPSRPFSLLSLD